MIFFTWNAKSYCNSEQSHIKRTFSHHSGKSCCCEANNQGPGLGSEQKRPLAVRSTKVRVKVLFMLSTKKRWVPTTSWLHSSAHTYVQDRENDRLAEPEAITSHSDGIDLGGDMTIPPPSSPSPHDPNHRRRYPPHPPRPAMTVPFRLAARPPPTHPLRRRKSNCSTTAAPHPRAADGISLVRLVFVVLYMVVRRIAS
jgi:hypothetical protein